LIESNDDGTLKSVNWNQYGRFELSSEMLTVLFSSLCSYILPFMKLYGARLSNYKLTSCSNLLVSDFRGKERKKKAQWPMVCDSASVNHNAAFALVYKPVELH